MQSRAIVRPLAAAAAATLLTAMGATAPAVAGGPEDDQRGNSAEATVKVEEKHSADDEQPGNSAEASVKVEEKHSVDEEQRGNSAAAGGASKSTEVRAGHKGTGGKSTSVGTGPDHSQGNASTQGAYDEPQPESNADKNDGGANAGSCESDSTLPYCSTRDGSASANGKGDGKATGRPAAATVGKADNKNPPGQFPGPDNDGNRGYECDQPGAKPNQGIAEGNPAHSACVEVVVTTPKDEDEDKVKDRDKDKVVVVVTPQQPNVPVTPVTPNVPVTPVTPAGPPVQPPVVLPVELEVPAQPAPLAQPPVVLPAPQVAGVSGEVPTAPTSYQTTGTLPATGAEDYTLVAAAGLAMTFVGLAVLTRRRVQAQEAPGRRR